jgi:hypothetical protein
MARTKTTEFQAFAITGKTQRCGELRMQGDEVLSYALLIAKVDRTRRILYFRGDARGTSRTTASHLAACTGGLPDGWTLVNHEGGLREIDVSPYAPLIADIRVALAAQK